MYKLISDHMMSITKSFDANGALEQVVQMCCGISLSGDLQKLLGNGPGPSVGGPA